MDNQKVIKAGVLGPKKLEWFEPRNLGGREPAVFTVLRDDNGSYTQCGAYCVIDYQRPRHLGPRRRTGPVEEKFFFVRVPRIRKILDEGCTVEGRSSSLSE